MSLIRIAHIVEATTGGVARHLIDIVNRLDPGQFASVLYLSFERPDSWIEPLRALEEKGILIRELPMSRAPRRKTVKMLADYLTHDAIDMVHTHSAKGGYHGRMAAQSAGLPALYTPHAFPFQRTTDWRRPIYRMIERKMAAITERIICVSKGEREEALAAGLPAEKCVVIPNGLDIDAWPLPSKAEREEERERYGLYPDDVVIGAMSRLVPQKGIDLLLEAAEDLRGDYPHIHFMFWGDGPRRRELMRLARRLRIPHVLFMGDTPDVRRAYMTMDIFCAPSRWEAAPYAVLEAMACGLPVVASAVPGHVDYIVHDVTGKLEEPELPGPIAGGLRALLASEDIRAAFGAAGRKRVESAFTIDTMMEELAALYQSVYAKKRTRRTV